MRAMEETLEEDETDANPRRHVQKGVNIGCTKSLRQWASKDNGTESL
jgi:hypothetical protein